MAGKGDVINQIADQAGISKKEAAGAFYAVVGYISDSWQRGGGSEERRGGEEGRSRWAPGYLKKKKIIWRESARLLNEGRRCANCNYRYTWRGGVVAGRWGEQGRGAPPARASPCWLSGRVVGRVV